MELEVFAELFIYHQTFEVCFGRSEDKLRACVSHGEIWGPDPLTPRSGCEKRKWGVTRGDLMSYGEGKCSEAVTRIV